MPFLHTELLEALKQRVKDMQLKHQTHMAKGLPEKEYWEAVGRHRECADLIHAIDEVAEENDDDDET